MLSIDIMLGCHISTKILNFTSLTGRLIQKEAFCLGNMCLSSAFPNLCAWHFLWQQYLALRSKNIDCSKFGISYFLQPKLLNGKNSPLQSTSRFIPPGKNKEETAVTTGSVVSHTDFYSFTLLLLKETKGGTNYDHQNYLVTFQSILIWCFS